MTKYAEAEKFVIKMVDEHFNWKRETGSITDRDITLSDMIGKYNSEDILNAVKSLYENHKILSATPILMHGVLLYSINGFTVDGKASLIADGIIVQS